MTGVVLRIPLSEAEAHRAELAAAKARILELEGAVAAVRRHLDLAERGAAVAGPRAAVFALFSRVEDAVAALLEAAEVGAAVARREAVVVALLAGVDGRRRTRW